jgi:nucleotide-binding universal stress UspA family protein
MRRLVVGIDGATSSRHALEWAAQIVGADGRIHAVTATDPEPTVTLHPLPADDLEYESGVRRELEHTWTASARALVGDVTVEVVHGDAPHALTSAAEKGGFDAIVVGSHVSAMGVPRRIGRTIRDLLSDLRCPLIVVPTSIAKNRSDDGPIIVGVGHSEATDAAVRWAAVQAAEHGRALGLVRATSEAPVFDVDGMLDLIAYYLDPAIRDEWVTEDLAALATVAQAVSENEIPIATTATARLPATTLVNESAAASLLVIGQHPSKVLGARHVTSSLRHALTHARCPVVVVPVPEQTY